MNTENSIKKLFVDSQGLNPSISNEDMLLGMSEIAVEVPEFREGYIYLLHRPGMQLKNSIVNVGKEGKIHNLLGKTTEELYIEFDTKFEFLKFKFTEESEIPALLLSLIKEHPGYTNVIKAQLRVLGIPVPPTTIVTMINTQEWIGWILGCELPFSPLAYLFIKAIEAPGSNLGVLDHTVPRPRPAQPTRSLWVEADLKESGYQSCRRFYSWSGNVEVPEDVIAEGEDKIRDYVSDWVQSNVESTEAVYNDEETGDCNIDDCETNITDYGDISSLLEHEDEDEDEEDM